MAFFVLRIVSVLVLGAMYGDGPMPPPLDLMMKYFGWKIYTGIEHARPLLLTYVPPTVQVDDDFSVPYPIPEWFTMGENPGLGYLILGLTFWAVLYHYDWIDSLGIAAASSVLEGDAEYKHKVLTLIKRKCSSGLQNGSLQKCQGFGSLLEIRLRDREGESLYELFYACQVDPGVKGVIRSSCRRTNAYLRRIFSVKMEIPNDYHHNFLLLDGPRDGVEAAYKYLKRTFGKRTRSS